MKRFLTILCALALMLCLLPATAFAVGEGNMDSGGGGMGQGTSTNSWTPGKDGVRITVVDAETGAAVSAPMDYSNTVQSSSALHFGKVSKLQYLNGTSLSPQSGVAYSCMLWSSIFVTLMAKKYHLLIKLPFLLRAG